MRRLASAAGITHFHLVQIEHDRVEPKLTTLNALCGALGCRLSDVIAGEEVKAHGC